MPNMNVLHRSRIPKKCIKSLHSNWKQNGSRNWKTCVPQCKNRFAPFMQMWNSRQGN